jgi:tetratricopeptide (TPR) repeat protein
MARGAANQKKKAAAAPPKRTVKHGSRSTNPRTSTMKGGMAVEDTMFFPRLRNHAKPVFVFLAVIFGAGFVFLGVGSGSSGISDLLNPSQWFGGGASTAGLSSLQKKAAAHPAVAQAQLDYAQALDAKGRSAAAIALLERYIRLRPRDSDVLSDLAGRYENQEQLEYNKAQAAQIAAQDVSGTDLFPQLKLGKGGTQTIGTDPVISAVTSKSQLATQNAQAAFQRAAANDVRVLKLLAIASPDDTTSIFRLATAASQAGDTATAKKNYKLFLKLAPDAPEAALAKQRLKALQTPSVSTSQGG